MIKKILVLSLALMTLLLGFSKTELKAEDKKTKALILVNTDEEKKLFAGLIDREENFDFQIDIVSLKEKKVQSKAFAIRKFLWQIKDQYDFFVLHEDIPYGEINKGEVITDYYYAHSTDIFSHSKDNAEYFGRTVERYPELILSRIRNNQIDFYSKPKKRADKINALFGLPFVCFNRNQTECGVGNYQVDLSYTGDFFKNKFGKINPNMTFLRLYDDKSRSILLPKSKQPRKERKKPDMYLNRENFIDNENKKNFFLLFSTYEPLAEEQHPWSYLRCFTSALWEDKNRDQDATELEITLMEICDYQKMNAQNNFSFYCVPTGNKNTLISAPLIITPAFTTGEESDPAPIGYLVDDNPEGSSVSTAWNAILTDIVKGKTFSESVLLGYTNYFKTIKEKDDYSQALNATRLTCFGLPWYTINDLIAQPQIQIKKDYYQTSEPEIIIPIRNVGDKKLVVKVEKNQYMDELLINIEPEQIYELTIKNEKSTFPLRLLRLPHKKCIPINLQTNDLKYPNVQLVVEFWEWRRWLAYEEWAGHFQLTFFKFNCIIYIIKIN